MEWHLQNAAIQHLALSRQEVQATLMAMEKEKAAMMQVLGQDTSGLPEAA